MEANKYIHAAVPRIVYLKLISAQLYTYSTSTATCMQYMYRPYRVPVISL